MQWAPSSRRYPLAVMHLAVMHPPPGEIILSPPLPSITTHHPIKKINSLNKTSTTETGKILTRRAFTPLSLLNAPLPPYIYI